jgi:PTH2 family peptidyl-tRNA hydrolase
LIFKDGGDMKYKLVIAVREDLKLSVGKISVQVAHAAVACAFQAKKNHMRWYKTWKDEGAKKVVVKVEDEEALFDLERLSKSKKIESCVITDAGLTEIPPGTVTCIGIGPGPNEIIDQITGDLPLL